MSINFCDPVLRPLFSCQEPCHDGYPIINLGSRNSSERRKGFIGYGSPPVTVTVQFLSSINIERVVIHPQVLSQKSLGFEISVRCAVKKKQTWQSYSSSRPRHNIGTCATQPPVATFEGFDDSFHRIGSILLDRIDKGAVFSKYGSTMESLLSNFAHRNLFQHNAMLNADRMQIKIFKTAATSPALGGIEVWGEPSSSCPRKMRQDILGWWTNRHCVPNPIHTVPLPITAVVPETAFVSELRSECKIPEEFLDALTCDIMALPFILPSGKVVDFQTLEKHKNFEEMYGRAPCDPFTGKLFTQGCSPVPDNDLKRRINHFLLENSYKEELANIPRTTGRPTTTRSNLENNIRYNKSSNMISESFTSTQIQLNDDFNNRSNIFPVCPSSETSYSNFIGNTQKRKVETVIGIEDTNDKRKRTKGIVSATGTELCGFKGNGFHVENLLYTNKISVVSAPDCSKSQDQLLEDSLESALKSVLSGRPTFVNFHSTNATALKANYCIDCKSVETLYRLPCAHLICRSCLVLKKSNSIVNTDKQIVCTECRSLYAPSSATRFHNQ